MNRDKRDVRPGRWQKEPYEPLPDTTVIPKKRVGRKKKMPQTKAIQPPQFDDSDDNDVVVTHSEYTGNFISFYNVDPNKVIVTFIHYFLTIFNNYHFILIFFFLPFRSSVCRILIQTLALLSVIRNIYIWTATQWVIVANPSSG